MEKKTEKRRRLKRRILVHITLILTVSMVISTAISYVYFNKIARSQAISENLESINEVSDRIEYMLEDIENFTRSVIVDETLQKALEEVNPSTEFERLKKRDTISRRLAFYNGLRLFVGGTFLETENGEKYSSVSNSQSQDYLREKLASAEIGAYKNRPEWTFSDPYYGMDTWSSWQLVCFRTDIMDKYHFGQKQGTLYTEINLEYFMEPVTNYGQNYENVCLTGNDGILLYEKQKKDSIYEMMQKNSDYQDVGIHKTKKGYLLCKEIEGTGWKLCALITNQYLWQQSKYVLEFFFISFLISFFAIIFTTSRQLEEIIHPIAHLSEQMEKTDYKKLTAEEVVQTGDEIQTLYECYNAMVDEINRGIEEKLTYEHQKQEMEFDIMLSQINPHYLYNVLNTVVYLAAAGKNKEVSRIANSLIYSLQETLQLGEKNIETSVEKELELMRCYLTIQQYRYPDTFEVFVQCEESLLTCLVPKTIIQPLVENAILHGVLPMERKGQIWVTIEREKDILYIWVKDNGIGVSDKMMCLFEQKKPIMYEENGRKHIGISNVRDRIEYLYGEPYGMSIERIGDGGTLVTLRLPIKLA